MDYAGYDDWAAANVACPECDGTGEVMHGTSIGPGYAEPAGIDACSLCCGVEVSF